MNNQKKAFISGGIIVILVVLGIGGFMLYRTLQPSPTKVWNSYIDLLKHSKYEDMYAQIDKSSQKTISKEDFVKRNKNIYEGIGASDFHMTTKGDKRVDDGKQIAYQMSFQTVAGKLSYNNQVTMVKEGGSYKIDWNSSLILPALTNADKVSVQVANAKRGSILDRNGDALAKQGSVYKVGFVAGSMKDEKASIKDLAKALGMDEGAITNAMSASWIKNDEFVPIKTIAATEKEKLSDTLKGIDGVVVQESLGRVYPYGEMSAPITGYVQNVNADDLKKHKGEGYDETSLIGKSGLEGAYEKDLRGSDGYTIALYDTKGDLKKTVLEKAKQDGKDIKTTIDMKVQKILYEQIKKDAGCAISLNSKTGEVLGMVSMPTYDPNDFALGIDTKTWNALSTNKLNPFLNRVTSAYTPGSTFKAITGAVGLDTKTITPDTTFPKTNKWQKDKSWGNNYVTTTQAYSGPSNLKNAYINSDNIYFAQVADKIGAKNFTTYLDKIGFNKAMSFPLSVAKSTYGHEISNDQKLAATGYGQGDLLLSPLHLTALYTAYKNDGSILQPYLIYNDSKPSVMVKSAYTSDTAKIVMDDLVATMNSFGGGNPTNAGAKTGTAQVKNGDQEIGWTVAINDKYAVTVMIDDTKNIGEGHYVVPKIKNILNALQ